MSAMDVFATVCVLIVGWTGVEVGRGRAADDFDRHCDEALEVAEAGAR